MGNDELWWPYTSNGDFSVKSAYHAIRNEARNQHACPSSSMGIPKELWKLVWNAKVPQKLKLFLWKDIHNILPVQENIYRKRISRTKECPLCMKEPETVEHVFFRCDWTRPVWFGLHLGHTLAHHNSNSLIHWLSDWLKEIGKFPEEKELSIIKVLCTLWMIWKSRNAHVHQGQKPNPLATVILTSNIINDYSSQIHPAETVLTAQRRNTQLNQKWRPPLQSITKINVDSTFSKLTGVCFAGAIARNSEGDVVSGNTSFNRATSCFVAEALALRDAASLANNLGITNVVFESDCLDLWFYFGHLDLEMRLPTWLALAPSQLIGHGTALNTCADLLTRSVLDVDQTDRERKIRLVALASSLCKNTEWKTIFYLHLQEIPLVPGVLLLRDLDPNLHFEAWFMLCSQEGSGLCFCWVSKLFDCSGFRRIDIYKFGLW